MVVAKKSFVNTDDLEGEVTKKIMSDAALAEKKKSNAGSKPLPAEEKLSKSMIVYFTEEEKLSIKKHCKKVNTPFSIMIRQMLTDAELL
jgi:hypothetical protein